MEARLRETPDGCELLALDDHVLYAASGRGARTACLRRAAEAGVVLIVR